MFYNILDEKRLNILPLLEEFKDNFYLAGGTALALQLGHRDSIDFDFFTKNDINTQKLFEKIKIIFQQHTLKRVQDEKNTLTIIIDNNIKISFFTYKYKLLNQLHEEPYLQIASIEDIACMKLNAIVSRSTMKDYVDLFFILQKTTIKNLLNKYSTKFPSLDTNLILKSLVYFDDIVDEPIIFKNNFSTNLEELKNFFIEIIKKYN